MSKKHLMTRSFTLLLRKYRQLVTVQARLLDHANAEHGLDDAIQIVVQDIRGEDLYQVIIAQGMTVETIPSSKVRAMLIHRFWWPAELADEFIAEGSQIRLFTAPNGAQLYYCQPIDADMAMISFGH